MQKKLAAAVLRFPLKKNIIIGFEKGWLVTQVDVFQLGGFVVGPGCLGILVVQQSLLWGAFVRYRAARNLRCRI